MLASAAEPALGQERPWRLDVAYTGDLMANVRGGAERGVVALDNADVQLSVWPGRVFADLDEETRPRTTVFLYGLGNQGGSPSTLVGDAQGVNNIEAPTSWRLYEAWVEHILIPRRLSVLAGLYDLNSEFDVLPTGELFLHSSHGIGADFGLSGRNGPSIFAVTSLAVRVRGRLTDGLYAQGAVFDGVPGLPDEPGQFGVRLAADEGVLGAGEVGYVVPHESTDRDGVRLRRNAGRPVRAKVAVGAWGYTTPLRDWTSVAPGVEPQRRPGSWGAYVLADAQLWAEPGASRQGLSAFVRVGWAAPDFNQFAQYAGSGVVYTGLLPARSDDRVGLAVAAARNGGPYRAAQRRLGRATTATEVSIELTYEAVLAPWLALRGDVQHVRNPGTDPTRAPAWVLGLRVVATPQL